MYSRNPSKPKFIELKPMPDQAGSRNPPSVLITIERNRTEDVVRHARKTIRPMQYLLRGYCFMARRVNYPGKSSDSSTPDLYNLRVTCAGVSKSTKSLQGPRPLWMEPIELKVTLFSDSTKENPTIEPITVAIAKEGTYFGATDLGKAVCVYTNMRRKDNLGNWEPYLLQPQWIKVIGGTYGNQKIAEILVAFELMLWKERDKPELRARNMWPAIEDTFDRKKDFCKLRKAL